jgi:hypothetical protein
LIVGIKRAIERRSPSALSEASHESNPTPREKSLHTLLVLGRSRFLDFSRVKLELQVHVGDLDLDGLTLVAVVVLPPTLAELAAEEESRARLR